MNLSIMNDWQDHIGSIVFLLLTGSAFTSFMAHAVSTFPTPKSVYWQWVLGMIKFAVGQRLSALNAMNGLQSETIAITSEQKHVLANGGATLQVTKANGVTTDVQVIPTPRP